MSADQDNTGDVLAFGRGPRWQARPLRRRPVALSSAAVATVVLLVIAISALPGAAGHARMPALTFSRHGHYLDVAVRDQLADPQEIQAELLARGLHIRLILDPCSPSLVGIAAGTWNSPAEEIVSTGRREPGAPCRVRDLAGACQISMRVPVGFHRRAIMSFCRVARPGERYVMGATAIAPQELLHGLRIAGKTVSDVLTIIARRGGRPPVYLPFGQMASKVVGSVPRTWYVYNAIAWAPGQVLLEVGRTRQPHLPGTPVPVSVGP